MKVSKEFKVGLFMIVALVLLYFGFNFLKGVDLFETSNKYYALYKDVDGLNKSNPVFVNGFAVGRVSDIRILQDRNNQILVEIDVDSDVILGDSTIAILNSDFLGNKSILLTIGRIRKQLQPGDTVKTALDRGIASIIAENAVPVADNIQTTLKKINIILDNLARNTGRLDTMFLKLESTPNLVNRTLINANGNMNDLTTSLKSVAENVNGTLGELKPTLANFRSMSDSLKAIQLNGTLTRVQETLNKINTTMDKFNKGDNTVNRLLTEDSLYVNLNTLILNLDTLANHFNANPNHFLAPFGKSKKRIERDLKKQGK